MVYSGRNGFTNPRLLCPHHLRLLLPVDEGQDDDLVPEPARRGVPKGAEVLASESELLRRSLTSVRCEQTWCIIIISSCFFFVERAWVSVLDSVRSMGTYPRLAFTNIPPLNAVLFLLMCFAYTSFENADGRLLRRYDATAVCTKGL